MTESKGCYLQAEIMGWPDAVQPIPLLCAFVNCPDEVTVML